MPTLRQHAAQAWLQEQQKQKQAELKKHKRRAKKIEESIAELLPRDFEDPTYERNLDDPAYGVVISIVEPEGTTRFVYDTKDNLAIIGTCPACNGDTVSQPVESLEELGRMIERFEPGTSHACKSAR